MVNRRTSSGAMANKAQMSIEEYIVMSAPFKANRSDAKIMEARFGEIYLAHEKADGHVARLPIGEAVKHHAHLAHERRRLALEFLSRVPFATVSDVEHGINSEWARVRKALTELANDGLIVSMHFRNSEYLYAIAENEGVLRKHIKERKRNANKTRDRRTVARPENGTSDRKPARATSKVQRGGPADRGAS